MNLDDGNVVLHCDSGAQVVARRRYLREDPAESPTLVGAAAIQQCHAIGRDVGTVASIVDNDDDGIAVYADRLSEKVRMVAPERPLEFLENGHRMHARCAAVTTVANAIRANARSLFIVATLVTRGVTAPSLGLNGELLVDGEVLPRRSRTISPHAEFPAGRASSSAVATSWPSTNACNSLPTTLKVYSCMAPGSGGVRDGLEHRGHAIHDLADLQLVGAAHRQEVVIALVHVSGEQSEPCAGCRAGK